MAQNQQHGDQAIGSGNTQDGIQGTPSGTEGATTGQGVEKGQSKQRTQDQGNRQSSGGTETYQRNDLFEDDGEDAELSEAERARSQQSAQREGLGSRQHSGRSERGNRQGLDTEQNGE
ncbi:hypothetical protein GCM10027277_12090 [Pseudoduganella ginsengisoli]|uniref:Uncharacterized protein n=1 Tax=Pseudoduganella ginsengisoli TaxID=1462440 RepID=A0A6L6PWI8_9BURK|nr:hypothetical protein [Pseudoduganella ginsengisoli]MTW01599.1 hypothetical protein [Pseudoduganella ginsengisoli]